MSNNRSIRRNIKKSNPEYLSPKDLGINMEGSTVDFGDSIVKHGKHRYKWNREVKLFEKIK